MADYFLYEMRFVDEEESIADEIGGMLSEPVDTRNGVVSYAIDLGELSCKEENKIKGKLRVWKEGNAISFETKWGPNDKIATLIGKQFPGKIVSISRNKASWYEKDGEITNRDGKKIQGGIGFVPKKLVKECSNGRYKVSLNLQGKGWGTFFLSPSDCTPLKRDATSLFGADSETYGYSVMFTNEDVSVVFGRFDQGKEKMPVKDLIDRYFAAAKDYMNDMSQLLYVGNLPEDAFKEKQGDDGSKYYLVDIPVMSDVAESCSVTVAVSEIDANPEAGSVCIGQKGRKRSAMTSIGENGSRIKISVSNKEIFESHEKLVSLQSRGENVPLQNASVTFAGPYARVSLEEVTAPFMALPQEEPEELDGEER